MSDHFQPGQHPDADQLSAFAENALPAHEREATLAHLAECAHCRMIVSLALPPEEELLPQPAAERKPWFAGWRFAWPAVAAGFAALAVFAVHMRHTAPRDALTRPTLSAVNTPEPLPRAAEPMPPSPAAKAPPGAQSEIVANKPSVVTPPRPTPSAVAAAPPIPDQGPADSVIDNRSISNLPVNNRSYIPLGGPVSGSMARSEDRPVARQQSQLSQQQPNSAIQSAGMAQPAPAAPAPMIAANIMPPPPPPKVPTSVSAPPHAAPVLADVVTAESASAPIAINGLSNGYGLATRLPSQLSSQLPSQLPAASLLTSGNQTLALDTRGALFLSEDGGRIWLPVSTPWKSRAIRVALANFSPTAARDKSKLAGEMTAEAEARAASVNGSFAATPGMSAGLSGTVSDRTGATIPGASVAVRESRGALLHIVQTDGKGRFALEGLPPDTYAISTEAHGFATNQLTVALVAAKSITVNVVLDAGAMSEAVNVTSDAAQLETNVAKRRARKIAAPAQALAVFEVTTEAGEHWTSANGRTWKRR